MNIEWSDKKSLCVVLCSKGYPETFEKNVEIKKLNEIETNKDNYIFHAGTKDENGNIYAIGGRVLNFVCISDDFSSARKNIINSLELLNWQEGFYRKDIGYKVIK